MYRNKEYQISIKNAILPEERNLQSICFTGDDVRM